MNFIKSDSLWVITYVEAWGIASTNNQDGLTAIGSGLGVARFKEVMDEKAEEEGCQANLGACFYVPFLDMFGCMWEWAGDRWNC